MKMLTLLGSARPKGNTASILGWVEDELKMQGHVVERVDVTRQKINGCLGCLKCRETPESISCVQKDDANTLLERMLGADIILFGSPVYFWGVTAQAKAIMDRCYAFVVNYHQPEHFSLLRGKTIGLLTTGGGGYENNVEGIFDAFNRFGAFLQAGRLEKMHFGKCGANGGLAAPIKKQAMSFANALVGG